MSEMEVVGAAIVLVLIAYAVWRRIADNLTKNCPSCGQRVKDRALVCPYCAHRFGGEPESRL